MGRALIARIEAKGIGFGGLEGVSWLPGLTEEALPARLHGPGPARLPAQRAGGVLRPVPGRRRRLRGAARERSAKLALNDASFRVRAGDLGGARLRFPLRLSRAAAPGDRPGAPGARVRPRPDHHGALGGLRAST